MYSLANYGLSNTSGDIDSSNWYMNYPSMRKPVNVGELSPLQERQLALQEKQLSLAENANKWTGSFGDYAKLGNFGLSLASLYQMKQANDLANKQLGIAVQDRNTSLANDGMLIDEKRRKHLETEMANLGYSRGGDRWQEGLNNFKEVDKTPIKL